MAWAEKRGPWYRVRYRDAGGVVRTTPDKYRTKTEALESGRGPGHRPPPRNLHRSARLTHPLADWAGQWRQTHQVAASTQAKYDHYLDAHIIPAFGHLPLDQ